MLFSQRKLQIISLAILLISSTVLYAHASKADRIYVKGGTLQYKSVIITIQHFEIAKYEITNEQYAAFLNSKQIGSDGRYKGVSLINIISKDLQLEYLEKSWVPKKEYGQYPMVMVNYYGAVEYCNWVGGRLPTEVEWVYAAKGGAETNQFSFAGSNNYEEVGWYKNNSNQQAHPVGQKRPNGLGIYDMSGNVWEWCRNENVITDSSFCVHMGGSWYANEQAGRLDAHYGNTPTHFSNSVGFRVLFTADAISTNSYFFKNYTGKPWNTHPQIIPGKIQCEWYDLGGEGVAYHDNDSINNGSGNLNPANGTFLNEFRMREGVDISYTKAREIDNSHFNLVEPLMDQFYTGWTIPGEWINYTVFVKETGMYNIRLMYTASGNGSISLLLDGKELSSELKIPSTRNENETISWRQWHHWNRLDSMISVKIKKGKHVLTIKTISNGNMNYDYLEFDLIK